MQFIKGQTNGPIDIRSLVLELQKIITLIFETQNDFHSLT
jgi:hypothetical protein